MTSLKIRRTAWRFCLAPLALGAGIAPSLAEDLDRDRSPIVMSESDLPAGFHLAAGRVSHLAEQTRIEPDGMPRGWRRRDAEAPRPLDVVFDSPMLRDPTGQPAWLSPRIFVRWCDNCRVEDRIRGLDRLGVAFEIHDYAAISGLSLLDLDVETGEQVLNAIRSIQDDPFIDFVEADLMVRGRSTVHRSSDPLFGDSWQHRNVGQSGGLSGFDLQTDSAWTKSIGTGSHAVLVIDTGAEESHPDLRLGSGRDFTTGGVEGVAGGLPGNPCDSHGTPVAGCIAAIRDNGLGSVGIAPASRTLSARCMESDTSTCDGSWWTSWSWTVNALDWGVGQGVRVTNNSNFYGGDPQSIATAYEATHEQGMVHFASAGNDGSTTMYFPARLPSVHSVGAANRFGQRAGFSTHGPNVTIYGPGAEIPATDRTGAAGYDSGDYATLYGTSFASPLVAGVASLMLDVNPDLTADEIILILRSTCRDMGTPGFDADTGWGLVQADDALELATPEGCPGDLDDNGQVDSGDLGRMLSSWGPCIDCPGDLDGNEIVNGDDLGLFVGLWGPCP